MYAHQVLLWDGSGCCMSLTSFFSIVRFGGWFVFHLVVWDSLVKSTTMSYHCGYVRTEAVGVNSPKQSPWLKDSKGTCTQH